MTEARKGSLYSNCTRTETDADLLSTSRWGEKDGGQEQDGERRSKTLNVEMERDNVVKTLPSDTDGSVSVATAEKLIARDFFFFSGMGWGGGAVLSHTAWLCTASRPLCGLCLLWWCWRSCESTAGPIQAWNWSARVRPTPTPPLHYPPPPPPPLPH